MMTSKDLIVCIIQIVLFFALLFFGIIAIQYVFHFLAIVYEWALAPIGGGIMKELP
ncbi:hypothetical protein LVJ82_02160 [Vitreoscilla massiliensis]|uniref:Uncharacterized protein n=1 Tax=Vitreoscilla massiliensis TaxID=1689272 RepID=A0ABY4E206_9NEIS|nr:hypothetical protein [Vitreoscilla massiliensis]UOO89815.1 hypothetical protein LVJ82_02160 [Vitreoscilla massiliensis]